MKISKRVLLATSAAPSQSPFANWEKRPPHGVGFLISMLRNAGHEVFFIDNYLEPTNFLETGYLQSNQIDYIGLSVNTICFRDTLRMLHKVEYLKRSGQWQGKIILGGPHTSVAIETIPMFVDHIVQGEGEQAIVDIVEGKVTDRIVRYPRIRDLDALPVPAWDLFTKLPYNWEVPWFPENPVFNLTTSRGCPFNCAFCSNESVWGKKYTAFSAERVVAEIEHLIVNYGAKGIYFRENNFTANRKRMLEFCNLLIEKEIEIRWACESRVDSLDRNLLELMHKAGARGFYFGVESGSQRILDYVNKRITVDQIRNTFQMCHDIGFKTAASIVVGLPHETEEDLAATDKLLKEINPTMIWSNVFVGIPNSKLYRYVVEQRLYEFIDDRGLIYLKGHNERTRRYYQNAWDADVPFRPKSPCVSVIMPAHNAGTFIEAAIQSILTQTHQDFELIVVNDGSTDDTKAILQQLHDPRINVIDNPIKLGQPKSRNNALESAKGKYIAVMDADDISIPHRLETQIRFLESNPDYALVGSYAYQIDESGRFQSVIKLQTEDSAIRKFLIHGNNFVHGSVMVRRNVLHEIGGYDERFDYAADYDLWLRIIDVYKVANLPEPLYCWRSSSTQISTAKKAEQDAFAEMARREARERADVDRMQTDKVCSEAHSLAMEGRLDEAVEVLNQRIEGKPNDALAHFCLGQLHEHRDERLQARACYENAVSLEPENICYLKQLAGFLLVEDGDTAKALAMYDRVLQIAPQDSETLLIRGNIAASNRQYGEAEQFYRKVLDVDPANGNAAENLETLSKLKREDVRDAARMCSATGCKAPSPKTLGTIKVTAIISAYNEGDVIYHVIGDLIHKGASVYLLDHRYTDNTQSDASKWLGKGLIHIESYPDDAHYAEENKTRYIWRDILKRKAELAAQLDADWFIHADADEFRESPWPGLTLREAFYIVDRLGYNAIDFELLNFRPVDNSFVPGKDVRQFLYHYEGCENYNTMQVKAWKNLGVPVDLVTSGGHDISFEGRKVFPIRFIHRHYPIRSQHHGLQKVFHQRKNRFCEAERSMAWHIQYDHILDESHNFIHDPARLTLYNGEEVRTRLLTDGARQKKEDSRTLEKLAASGYDTDKSPRYLGNYERYFRPLINDPVCILKLGVFRGGSLHLWRDFFKHGSIVGLGANAVSIDDPTGRIRFYQGLQQDTDLLDRIRLECASDGFDVIVDDASHVGELTRISFWHLFENHLKPGGIYVIEDWGTGYWDSFPDGKSFTPGENHLAGMVGFVKELVDECGMLDITHPQLGRNQKRDSRIERMEVCHGQIFIVKKVNRFGSSRAQREAVPHPQGDPPDRLRPAHGHRREHDADALSHGNVAAFHYEKGDLAKAQSHFEKAVELDPANPILRKNLADFLYAAAKQPEKALLHYEKALSLNPRDAETLMILGNIRAELGDFHQAREYYLGVLEIDPSNELAAKMFDALDERGQELGKGDPERHYREARVHARRGLAERAIGALEKLLTEFPDHARAHNDLGFLNHRKGNTAKALDHYEKAVALDPHNITALKNLADFYFVESDRIEDALSLYNRVLLEQPRDVEALKAIGKICIRLERLEDACTFFQTVMTIDPADIDTLVSYGHVLAAIGRYEVAETVYRRVAVLDPSNADARMGIEYISTTQGLSRNKIPEGPPISAASAATGTQEVSETQEVGIDWTEAFDYRKLTREELEEYSNIEVTEDLREGGIHAQKAWGYWFRYLSQQVWKSSLSKEIVSFCNGVDRPRILSLGCGYGGLELKIAQSLAKPYDITAVDINEHILAKARKEARVHDLDIRFLQLDLNFLDIQENSFDLIFAHASLHHLLNLEHVFHQIHKGLKDRGRLVVQDIIGKTQVLFWKDNIEYAKDVVRSMPARYTSGISIQHGIIPAYTEPSVQKGMEGIRQEEIPSLLRKYFFPIKMFEYGSFMRMICTHPELGPRFDPDKEEDRKYLESLFRLDLRQIEKKILRPTEMLAVYEKHVELDTRRIDAEGHVHLGNYLLRHDERDSAVRHFKSALLLDPGNHAARRSLAAAAEGSAPYARPAESVSATPPDDPMLAHAGSTGNERDRDETAEAFEKIRARFAAEGNVSEAVFALMNFLECYPDFAAAHSDLGVLYHERGDKGKALFHYQRAQELEPENITYLKTLADFHYVETRQIDKAVSLYQKSVALHSRDLETHLILGNIDVERSQFDTALVYFIEALKIDPANEHALRMVGALKAKIRHQVESEQNSQNSIQRNKLQWSNYAWPEGGDEWSASWGGTEALWHKTILPRIGSFLPAEHILEIAPGYGRCTQFLVTQCRSMTLVDLTEKCIEACRQRFKDHRHIRCFVNDGKSLDSVEDNSVDFAFSWDSLVHVENDVMQAYLRQLASKLKPGGICFLHHSNIGAFRDAATRGLTVENRHWRGESMSAELFRAYCLETGLQCLSQEIIAWGGEILNDCFSVAVKGDPSSKGTIPVVENPLFMQEASGKAEPPDFYRGLGLRKGPFAVAAPEESYRRARGFIEESRFAEAARALVDYLVARPDDALAHNDLGCLSYRQGAKDAALVHYEKAVELEPANTTYLKNLADFYHVEQGRTDDALRLYHRILTDNPDDAEILLALGHVCIAVDRLDDSRSFFQRALASDPENEAARTILERLDGSTNPGAVEDGSGERTTLSIIIPAGDDPKTLSRCIGTVLQTTERVDYEIVATSGLASAGGEESFVPAGEKKIRLFVSESNGNPVRALNAAVRKALGRYLVLMDSRIVLTQGWLEPLLKTAATMPRFGAVSPKVGIPPDTLIEAGFSVAADDAVRGNGEGSRIDAPRYNYACETPSGSRYMTLLSRADWERCGGFDERLTDFGMALLDLSMSIRSAGKSLFYQPLSAIGLVEPPSEQGAGKDAPLQDSGWLSRLRPSPVRHSAEEAGRKMKSVLVLGVYLADRLNAAEDIVTVLSSSTACRVTQRWVALGSRPPTPKLEAVTVRTIMNRTPKFQIVNDLLAGEDLSRYDYVLLTDDDVVMPDGFLDAFTGLQEKLGFVIAQPARTPNSYIDHPIVEQANGLLARETRFVEIGPVVSFHRSVYDLVFPFDLASPMGWGYENVWSFRLGKLGLKMGIVDVTPVDHSIRKPVANYDWSAADRQRAYFLDRNEHLPLDTCFTTLQAIRLEGDPK